MSRIKPHKLSLVVQYASDSRLLPQRTQLRRWISTALKRDARITLRIVDEAEGRKLNKDYRGKEYATNVLTFVYDEENSPENIASTATRLSSELQQAGQLEVVGQVPRNRVRPMSRHGSVVTGDVVICAPVVEKEATEQHKDLLAHYAHLAIHATLHLQGYGHEDEADANAMESLETALMLKLRYPDPYLFARHKQNGRFRT